MNNLIKNRCQALFFSPHRKNHRNLFSIFEIPFSEMTDQVPFLEQDPDEDITGGGHRKKEVSEGHSWGAPKGDEETQHDGMADHLVEPWGLECAGERLLVP